MIKFLTDILKSVITYLVFAALLFLISFSYATKEFPPNLKKLRASVDTLKSLLQPPENDPNNPNAAPQALDFGNFSKHVSNMNKRNLEALNALEEKNHPQGSILNAPVPQETHSTSDYKERLNMIEKQNQQILLKIDRIENYLAGQHRRMNAINASGGPREPQTQQK